VGTGDRGELQCREYARLQQMFAALRPVLNERTRRLVAAAEARSLGRGGISLVSAATGMSRKRIARGIQELADPPEGNGCRRPRNPAEPPGNEQTSGVCRPHLGRRRIEEKHPEIEAVLEQILADEVAGNPMSKQKWVRSSLKQLSRELGEKGYRVSHNTMGRLLKKMDFSLKISVKKKRGFGADSPKRDEQFKYIALQRREFAANGQPVISVDTKKKELIGDFKKSGKAWCRQPEEVHQYDFTSMAVCLAVPYGIYDVTRNAGYVYVGTSGNTPKSAVDAIARWWRDEGRVEYPYADKLLILADGGGGNGWRSRSWKHRLQNQLCDEYGLTITVCHYPTRCSKWNPVERRLFSQISMNWSGKPLRTLEAMLGYIRDTKTTTGLSVKAFLQEGHYERGQGVSKRDMEKVNLQAHGVCPNWNYTIRPCSSS
jgi:hypothetical protein